MSTILFIINAISYIALSTFAVFAFFWLRRMKDDILGLKTVGIRALTILHAMKIEQGFDQIAKMQRMLKDCIKNEQFEEAKRLNDLITSQLKEQKKQIQEYNEIFGDFSEISVESFGSKTEED